MRIVVAAGVVLTLLAVASPLPAQRANPLAEMIEAGEAPQAMLEALLKPPPQSRVEGKPLSLVEALRSAATPEARIAVAREYWATLEALAALHAQLEYSQQLHGIQARREEAATLRTAQAAAKAAEHQARLALTTAQLDLAHAARAADASPGPLPSDLPFFGPYNTRYREMSAQQTLPRKLATIDRTLPLQRQLIEAHAAVVSEAIDGFNTAVEGHRAGHVTLAGLLSAADDLRRYRLAFVAAVVQYNRAIAEYAFTSAPQVREPQQLVAMLIRPKKPAAAAPREIPARESGPAAREHSTPPRDMGLPARDPGSLPRGAFDPAERREPEREPPRESGDFLRDPRMPGRMPLTPPDGRFGGDPNVRPMSGETPAAASPVSPKLDRLPTASGGSGAPEPGHAPLHFPSQPGDRPLQPPAAGAHPRIPGQPTPADPRTRPGYQELGPKPAEVPTGGWTPPDAAGGL